MKRFLAAVLALAMMASLSVAAFAVEDIDLSDPDWFRKHEWTTINGCKPGETVYLERSVKLSADANTTFEIEIPGYRVGSMNVMQTPECINNAMEYTGFSNFILETADSRDYQPDKVVSKYNIRPKESSLEVGTVIRDTLELGVWLKPPAGATGGVPYKERKIESYTIVMTITDDDVPAPGPDPDDPKPDNPDPDNPDPDKPDPDKPDPEPDKPDPKPDTPTPGPAVDDDDDDDSPTDNKANDDKTLDNLKDGENVVLKLTNGSAAIRFDTMDALGASNGSLTIQNGKATITIPGGFGAVNEPGRIYYPFDCDSDFPYSEDVDETFRYGNDYSYEKAKIGANETTLPTTAKVTLNTNLTGTVEVYKYDYMRRTYKLVTTTTENNGAVTFNTKEMGDFVLVQKGKTPTPVIPGDVNSAIAEINAERAKRGLPALQVDSKLMAAAAQRAKEQPISFGHTRPDGSQVNDSLPGEFGITGVWENCGTMPTPGGAIAQWMDDPPHRDILMASAPTKVGVGYCYDPNSPYKNYWVFLATW